MNTIAKGLAMQERAKKLIPGMTQLLSKRPDRFSLGVWPGYYSRALGARVWDLDGNEYLDMSIGGIGATVLGYADPDVDEAVVAAVRSGVASSLNCHEEVELAELLGERHPWAAMVRLTRGGGEAMAVAVRIARAHTGRDKVAFCGYHGWHDWYLAANVGGAAGLDGHHISGLNSLGVPQALAGTALPFHYNRLDQLQEIARLHGPELAAIIMEPIRSSRPEPGFLEGVRAIADEFGCTLIMDEISAGLRLNSGGSHLVLSQVRPDLAVFSKALGNGYPIAAVIGREAVMESAQRTFLSSTNWTERTGPAAALATLRKHQAVDASRRLVELGGLVQQGWMCQAQAAGLKLEVSGIEPLSHFSFLHQNAQEMKALFIQEMLQRGFLASNLFYAMYAHTTADVDTYIYACGQVFALIAEALHEGDIRKQLRGKPAAVGFQRLA